MFAALFGGLLGELVGEDVEGRLEEVRSVREAWAERSGSRQ